MSESSANQRSWNALLRELQAAHESGKEMNESSWVTKHPGHSDAIKEFFAERVDQPTLNATSSPLSSDSDASSDPDNPTLDGSNGTSVDDPTITHFDSKTVAPEKAVKLVGRQFGDYELLDEIARGGMGVIYRARQVSLNRTVAVKMILSGALASETDRRRFRTEAEAVAQLDHSNIVSIFEIGSHDEQHFFSMPFIEGESLGQRIARGPLQPTVAAEIVREIAEAMDYAHAQGVIHRDLKPSNILLTHLDEPKVTDFGLAKRSEQDGPTTTGDLLGTPGYMSPEQAGGKVERAGAGSDVYGLGAILYASLTGRPPFQAATIIETVTQVLESEPVPPRQLNRDVPVDLQVICLKALRKEPSRRFESAQAFADDLQRFLDGEPILARPVGGGERIVKWVRRRPAIAAMFALITLVTVIGITGVVFQWRAAERARRHAEDLAESEGISRDLADRRARELADAQDELIDQIYASDLMRADFMLESGDAEDAEEVYLSLHLERPPDKRRFSTWRLLKLYSRYPCVGRLSEPLQYLAYGGGRIVGTRNDQLFVFRDTGELEHSFRSESGNLFRPAVSPNGKRVACGHFGNGEVLVWDLDNVNAPPLSFTPEGRVYASMGIVGDAVARVTLTEEERAQVNALQEAMLKSRPDLVFLSDERLVGTSQALGLVCWDIPSRQAIHRIEDTTRTLGDYPRIIGVNRERQEVYFEIYGPQEWRLNPRQASMVARVSFNGSESDVEIISSDRSQLYSYVYARSTIIRQALVTLFAKKNERPKSRPPEVALGLFPALSRVSNDGKQLITALPIGGNDYDLLLFDLETNELLAKQTLQETQVGALTALRFSPDDRYLLIAAGRVHVFELPSLQHLHEVNSFRDFFGNDSQAPEIAFGADSESFYLASYTTDSTKQQVRRYPFRTTNFLTEQTRDVGYGRINAFTNMSLGTGELAAQVDGSGEQRIGLWRNGEFRETSFQSSLLSTLASNSNLSGAIFSEDGEMLFVAISGRAARIVAVSTENLEELYSIPLYVRGDQSSLGVSSLTMSADGMMLAAAVGAREIALVDLRSRQVVKRIKQDVDPRTVCLCFSPDGMQLVGTSPKMAGTPRQLGAIRESVLFLIDVVEGEVVRRIRFPLAVDVQWLADAPLIAVAAIEEGGVLLLDPVTLEVQHVWNVGSTVRCLAISPKEPILSAGTEDGSIALWDMSLRKPLSEFPTQPYGRSNERPITVLRFTDDGQQLRYITRGFEGRVRFDLVRDRLERVLESLDP